MSPPLALGTCGGSVGQAQPWRTSQLLVVSRQIPHRTRQSTEGGGGGKDLSLEETWV